MTTTPGRATERRRALVALGLAAMLLVPGAAIAEPPWEPTPGGWVSGPVEYVKTIPIDAGGGVGGIVHEDFLYVSTWRSFSIYDISDNLNPLPLSTIPLPAYLYNEQPDTNGEILLLTKDVPEPTLEVWDVSNKTLPLVLASLSLPKPDHMWTCVLSCRYAYGGRGTIVDLADPATPRIVGDWAQQPVFRFHAIEEVAPGLVLTGTLPAYYLDARKDPTRPRIRATFEPRANTGAGPLSPLGSAPPGFIDWPSSARDRFVLATIETPFSGECTESSGGFGTYDTKGWKRTHTFRSVDEYKMDTSPGTYDNGRAPYAAVGCTAYAFDVAPQFASERLVAVAWFENGMRLLEVDERGKIEVLGGFVPLAGATSTALWLDEETLYLIDLNRGIDILNVG